eukprot:TRINITY_DN4940_c0_g1_i1.p1 TRINITY_DN4940_c0_g1~~TRINITY_DN4940_c0_g1_i1.p1  ORF type:complete len:375 (-),score=145.39 TRINITY_DN4940_c0_g1_i1:1450-2574(-)
MWNSLRKLGSELKDGVFGDKTTEEQLIELKSIIGRMEVEQQKVILEYKKMFTEKDKQISVLASVCKSSGVEIPEETAGIEAHSIERQTETELEFWQNQFEIKTADEKALRAEYHVQKTHLDGLCRKVEELQENIDKQKVERSLVCEEDQKAMDDLAEQYSELTAEASSQHEKDLQKIGQLEEEIVEKMERIHGLEQSVKLFMEENNTGNNESTDNTFSKEQKRELSESLELTKKLVKENRDLLELKEAVLTALPSSEPEDEDCESLVHRFSQLVIKNKENSMDNCETDCAVEDNCQISVAQQHEMEEEKQELLNRLSEMKKEWNEVLAICGHEEDNSQDMKMGLLVKAVNEWFNKAKQEAEKDRLHAEECLKDN